MCTLLGVICGDTICGSIVPPMLFCLPPFCTGPLGSLIGWEVGGCAGGSVGVTGVLMAGLYAGLAPCVGGLVSCMGAVTGVMLQCCSDVINCCGAVC